MAVSLLLLVLFVPGGKVAYCVHFSICCHVCYWNVTKRGSALASEAGCCHCLLLHLAFLEYVSVSIS